MEDEDQANPGNVQRDFVDFDQYRRDVGALMKRASSGRNEITKMVKNVINQNQHDGKKTVPVGIPPADSTSSLSFNQEHQQTTSNNN